MIQKYVDRWEANKAKAREAFSAKHPEDYEAIVRTVVEAISSEDYGDLDPKRIHAIDDGDYQGTLLFVIAGSGYQPSDYWYVKVSYGSCSGCDTLQDISDYSSEAPTEKQVDEYMTLALHIVQGLKAMDTEAT